MRWACASLSFRLLAPGTGGRGLKAGSPVGVSGVEARQRAQQPLGTDAAHRAAHGTRLSMLAWLLSMLAWLLSMLAWLLQPATSVAFKAGSATRYPMGRSRAFFSRRHTR